MSRSVSSIKSQLTKLRRFLNVKGVSVSVFLCVWSRASVLIWREQSVNERQQIGWSGSESISTGFTLWLVMKTDNFRVIGQAL